MDRKATAIWNGSGKEGTGTLTTQSALLSDAQYSYHTRFENEYGTNPEELIAAAHAGCFSMKLAFVFAEAGITPEKIETECTVTLENGSITKSVLSTTVTAPGLTDEKLQECAQNAKDNCPVSKALSLEKSITATLQQ